jgi:hypothetical protein
MERMSVHLLLTSAQLLATIECMQVHEDRDIAVGCCAVFECVLRPGDAMAWFHR